MKAAKKASHEGVRLKLVKLKEYTNGNFWVLFGRIFFAKHNRYIALCMYCNKTLSGRLHFMRKHITDMCSVMLYLLKTEQP